MVFLELLQSSPTSITSHSLDNSEALSSRLVRSRDVAMMKWLAATAATDPWNKLVTGKLFFHLLAQKNATQFNFNFENWCSRLITPKWWTNPPKDLNIHETPRSVSFQVRYTSVTGLSAKPVRFATTKAPSEAMSLARHRSKFPPIFCHQQFSKQIFQNWQPKRTYIQIGEKNWEVPNGGHDSPMNFLGSKFNIEVKIMSDVKLDHFP